VPSLADQSNQEAGGCAQQTPGSLRVSTVLIERFIASRLPAIGKQGRRLRLGFSQAPLWHAAPGYYTVSIILAHLLRSEALGECSRADAPIRCAGG